VVTGVTLSLSEGVLVLKTAKEEKKYRLGGGYGMSSDKIPGLSVIRFEDRRSDARLQRSFVTLAREDSLSFEIEEGKPLETTRTEFVYKNGGVITRWRLAPRTR